MGLPLTKQRAIEALILAHQFCLWKGNLSHKSWSICGQPLDRLFQVALIWGDVDAGGIEIGMAKQSGHFFEPDAGVD